MRHGTPNNNRRNRNRNNNSGRRNNNQPRTQVYDSNGPDVRIRGTASQVAEKYLTLAKDATSIGDNMIAENYFQHAEHYIRIINEISGNDAHNKVKGLDNSKNIADDEGNKVEGSNIGAEYMATDDLALPASILGADTPSKVTKVATEQATEAVD